ncbi:SH3 and multiple ankyrin repeat domains protein 2 isoform X2 [Centruroides vittatus]
MRIVTMETEDNSINQTCNENLVSLRIFVPELTLQKCLQFSKEELIWIIKEQVLSSLPKELKESFNYGLFCPPVNGKAGKFLDEERPLADYPFPESEGYLELRYKRRIYKMTNMDEKHIKQLHTRANLRRMLEYISNGHVEKITKMCARGLDPNFHCPDTGETPLTVATTLKVPAKVIMALVNGGALLDFRTKDGQTSLHKAVERNNYEALKTLLDLGASPNYKDARGLTALYYSVLYGSDPQLTELLLHDHASIGSADPQGWQEVHQACKHGLVQHLEHLLFYGADMNARNASGNTPLHVCAVNDQESSARVLLFRGADKNALNYANQNPYQVAVIAGNLTLAEIIKNHRPEDIVANPGQSCLQPGSAVAVPYREAPQYNPRRRASATPLSRTHSDPRLELPLGGKPPSPCPSNCSLPPFSSISTISEASTGSSSTCTQPSGEDSEDTASASVVTGKSIASDSSGVCTSNSGASFESNAEHQENTNFMCGKEHNAITPGHVNLSPGDMVEILNVRENSLLEGQRQEGEEGSFSTSVEEVKTVNASIPPCGKRVEGRRELNARKMSTMPRKWKMYGEPRTVILHKGKKGFGFVLRGAKATSPLMERQPTEYWPSLQYLDDVDKGGIADLAGLKKGDFLLEINGQDVCQASHEHVVAIIRHSGDLVAMTVVTVNPPAGNIDKPAFNQRQCATLPRKLSTKKAPVPPKRDPRTTLSVGRVRARSMVAGLAEIEALDRTLNEYDSEGRSTKSSSIESIPNKQSKVTESVTPKIASIRSRPSSRRITAAELEDFFSRQTGEHQKYATMSHMSCRTPRVYGSVAAMKRSRASRNKLIDAFGKLHKEYHSTPDLNTDVYETEINTDKSKKTSQSQDDIQFLCMKNSRHSWAYPLHSSLSDQPTNDRVDYDQSCYTDSWKSIEEVYDKLKSGTSVFKEDSSQIYAQTLPLTKREKASQPARSSCPPPSHPPPPPPIGQVIKVDVSRALGEYANVHVIREHKSTVMSSFRPGDSAKLYASPEVVMSVGYKKKSMGLRSELLHHRRIGGGSSLRSHSLPPKIPTNKNPSQNTPSETETSGDSNIPCSAFRISSRQRDSVSSDSGSVSDKGTLKSLKGKSTMNNSYMSKFEVEESEVNSPQHYAPLRSKPHEPFIPEPDYESSDDDIPTSVDKGCNLSTFGKGDTLQITATTQERTEEEQKPISPHTEAKRAIQEAREILKSSQKSCDKINTDADHNVKESQSIYQSIQDECNINSERNSPKVQYRHPVSEKLKELNRNMESVEETKSQDIEIVSGTVRENIHVFEKKSEMASNSPNLKKGEGLRMAVTGSQMNKISSVENHETRCLKTSLSCPHDLFHDDAEKADNSSSGVSSDIESQCDPNQVVGKELKQELPSMKITEQRKLSLNKDHIESEMHHWNSKNVMYNNQFLHSNLLECLSTESHDKVATKNEECAKLSESIEESLQLIRVQVDSLALAAVNEVDVFTELVPPPPEFAVPANENQVSDIVLETIAPPPEFCDESSSNRISSANLTRLSSSASDSSGRSSSPENIPINYTYVDYTYPTSTTSRIIGSPRHVANGTTNVISSHHTIHRNQKEYEVTRLKSVKREFRHKPLREWNSVDVSDWLDSLFLPEYKIKFSEAGITGAKLANMDNNDLMGLGVKQVGHRLNMERSLKRYQK